MIVTFPGQLAVHVFVFFRTFGTVLNMKCPPQTSLKADGKREQFRGRIGGCLIFAVLLGQADIAFPGQLAGVYFRTVGTVGTVGSLESVESVESLESVESVESVSIVGKMSDAVLASCLGKCDIGS